MNLNRNELPHFELIRPACSNMRLKLINMKYSIIRFQITTLSFVLLSFSNIIGQTIPLDTAHLDIQARAHVIEKYKGQDAIYLQAGAITLKDVAFLNGTIEYDVFLKEEQAFPGIFFRSQDGDGNAEQFYIRPHQSGNPDANQAGATIKGITPWQLHFGEKYSFPYEYKFDDWTHVRILVDGDKAQVFLDYSEKPNLSWKLFHPAKKGSISLRGGNRSGMHLANIKIDHNQPEFIDFKPIEREAIQGLIRSWEISDKFKENRLDDLNGLKTLIQERKWQGSVYVEEGTAANISRIQMLRDGQSGNTVFAKINIQSETDQIKLFEFGYSDRVVAILNGKPIYSGTNRWRSRDYRYLGTVGLFDAIYLDLKKGENTLLMAVSEDFGGWLITGKIKDMSGVEVKRVK